MLAGERTESYHFQSQLSYLQKEASNSPMSMIFLLSRGKTGVLNSTDSN